jgi:arylsulfatase A-like enzyme
MKITLKIFLLLVSVCSVITGCSQAGNQNSSEEPLRPNIVIIFTDDQGYADLGCYGSTLHKTPRLDQLAREGLRFSSFYAQHVCGPSRSALLTGRYPIRSKGWNMPADEITWAELLQDAGYQTACIGKWDVSNRKPIVERTPNAQGFDYYFGTLGANDGGYMDFYEDTVLVDSTYDMGGLTKLYTDKAIDYLENKCDTDKPFVLYLAHTMMHMNIDATPEFTGKSEGGLYGDVVEEFDYETGRLLDVLEEMDLAGNTLVIYTTDNGPWNQDAYTINKRKNNGYVAWKEEHANFENDDKFWGDSGPLRNGKGSCYEGGIRVPCIVRWPGKVPVNEVSDAIFATIDFLPTFATLAGTEVPEDRKIDGVDQTDLLLGKSETGSRDNFFYVYAYRKGNWKYLAAEHNMFQYARDNERKIEEELYDLSVDISETNNLAAQNPEKVKELRALMEKEKEGLDPSVITKIR